jgi:hypothetical protein
LIQAALFVAIYLLGVAFAVALGPSRRTHLCCALAYPIGLVLWVGGLFAALALGLDHTGLMLVSLYTALLLGLTGVAVLRRRLGRHLVWPIARWTASFAIIACALASFSAARFGADSLGILTAGRVIDVSGLSPLAWKYMATRSVFHPVAHSAAGLLGLDYLHSHHAMLAVSFIIAFGFLLFQGLQRSGASLRARILITALVVSAMVSTRVITYHLSYVHMNFSTAVYLTLFVALFWLAEVDRDEELLPLSGVAMVGLGLQRLETGVVAALFLALLLADTRLATRPIMRSLGPAVAAIAAWFLLLAANTESQFVSPAKSALTIAALGGVFAYWRSGLWPGLRRRIPQIALAAIVVGVGCAFAVAPAHMATSASSLFENFFPLDNRGWGLAPWILVALAPLAAVASRAPFDRVFAYGIPAYLAFVLLVVITFRSPYRVMWADSGFRMVIHIVPLTFFFMAIRLGPLVEESSDQTTSPRRVVAPFDLGRDGPGTTD